MILPKGEVIYENLNTSFTNFGELLSNLKVNQTTGYVLVSFWEYEGVFFLDSGNIISAIEEYKNSRKIGQDAVNGLLSKAKQKDGMISVYKLSPDLVTILAGAIKSEIVYKELTSDFTNLEKLIEKLKIEQHTGYIEILTNDKQSTAIVFIQAGEPIESILATEDKVTSNAGIHPEIYKLVNVNGAVFNVYKAGLSINSSDICYSFDISQLLDFWGVVIAAIESKFEPEKFNQLFRTVLIDKADEYPYLDPFADEFNYANGKITFEGSISTNFSQGIAEVVNDLIIQISDTTILDEIETIKKAHSETIKKFVLDDILNNILK